MNETAILLTLGIIGQTMGIGLISNDHIGAGVGAILGSTYLYHGINGIIKILSKEKVLE